MNNINGFIINKSNISDFLVFVDNAVNNCVENNI